MIEKQFLQDNISSIYLKDLVSNAYQVNKQILHDNYLSQF